MFLPNPHKPFSVLHCTWTKHSFSLCRFHHLLSSSSCCTGLSSGETQLEVHRGSLIVFSRIPAVLSACYLFIFLQVCSLDVPARVRHAPGCQAWRQTVLQTFHQHTASGSCRPSHEGQHPLSDGCLMLTTTL